MWPRVINIVLGVWLMVVPSVLNYSKMESNNLYITGAIVITFAVVASSESVKNTRWVNFLAGIWLIFSTLLINPGKVTGLINIILSGTGISVTAAIKGKMKERFAGGWSALFGSGTLHQMEATKISEELKKQG